MAQVIHLTAADIVGLETRASEDQQWYADIYRRIFDRKAPGIPCEETVRALRSEIDGRRLSAQDLKAAHVRTSVCEATVKRVREDRERNTRVK